MTNQKISVNADHVLQTISQYPRPASLKQIADASGDANIQSLEKHQVRHAVDKHLLENELVEEYSKEVDGNEVVYYTLTESGQARLSTGSEGVEQLESDVRELEQQVEDMREDMDEVADFINGELDKKMREFGSELDKTQEAVIERKVRIERIVEVLSDEFDREIGLHVYA